MIKLFKKIIELFRNFVETIGLGLYYLCLIISKGFFFYFYALFAALAFIFRFKFMEKIKSGFKYCQKTPIPFLAVSLVCLFGVFFYVYLYSGNNQMVHIPDNIEDIGKKDNTNSGDGGEEEQVYTDDNLYRKYAATSVNDISFSDLKSNNPDVVAWIVVDGTNINYPIVQTDNNDYYLYHDINGTSKISGWTFMDYRNSRSLSDQNTIFYGHNLLNKTAFGSVSNIFTDDWFYSSSHKIIVATEEGKFVYQIFSNYYIEPEVYYLQNNFSSNASYEEFLNTLKGRSVYDYGVELGADDRIITLSTCTEDNTGRKVVHAKLINE